MKLVLLEMVNHIGGKDVKITSHSNILPVWNLAALV